MTRVVTIFEVIKGFVHGSENNLNPFTNKGSILREFTNMGLPIVGISSLDSSPLKAYKIECKQNETKLQVISYAEDQVEAIKDYANKAMQNMIVDIADVPNKDLLAHYKIISDLFEQSVRVCRDHLIVITPIRPVNAYSFDYPLLYWTYAERFGLTLEKALTFESECSDQMLHIYLTKSKKSFTNSYGRSVLYNRAENQSLFSANAGLKELTLRPKGTQIMGLHEDVDGEAIFEFRIAGINMSELTGKIHKHLKNNYAKVSEAKIRLTHKPFKSEGDEDPNAVAIELHLPKKDKWIQIGWIPRKSDKPGVTPNRIVSRWICQDKDKKDKVLLGVWLSEFDIFIAEGEPKYYGKVCIKVNVNSMNG
jgi:hypothetical protein